MADEIKVKCHSNSGNVFGPVWVVGWLFSIGLLKLTFWKGVLAIIVWPYYLGVFLRK